LCNGFAPMFFWGKKYEKKGSLTIITMMNMWDNEFKIEKNVFIHSINILPNVVPNETYIILSLSLFIHPTNLQTNKGCVTL
jgi:hypothetical protein